MTSLSDGPFQRVQQRAGLVLGTTLSEHRGQARRVCLLESHPNWIYKEYNDDTRRQTEAASLDQLIAFPDRLPRADREIVSAAASWPTARVVDDDGTLGVILPLAPDIFRADVRGSRRTRSELLTIGLLAQRDTALEQRGLPAQPPAHRVRLCLSLATTAALLERHGIVYLDWSFANAFWSPTALTTYLIDMDGCSFGARPLIQTHGWDDPLVPLGSPGGQPVDRYRVALLVGRCLTGERMLPQLPAALAALATTEPRLEKVCRMVSASLHARNLADRPSVAALTLVLRNAAAALGVPVGSTAPPAAVGNTGNVTAWVPIGERRRPNGGAVAPPMPSVPAPRQAPPPSVPLPVPAQTPWTAPVPVPLSQPPPPLPVAAKAALVLLGVFLALVLVAYIII